MSGKILKLTRGLTFAFWAGTAFFCWTLFSSAAGPNEAKTFNISPVYDSAGRSQIQATLRQVGDKAVFYVDDEWWRANNPEIANKAISDLSVEFDKNIYPKLTQVYGSEWSPGIDNNLRIVVLLSKMRNNVGGYFDSADEFYKNVSPLSNESELIYLNISFLNTLQIKIYLAHEFQHLITFYQKERLQNTVDDVWFNEARSEYAATLGGYDNNFTGSNLEKRAGEFLRDPSDSLTEWQDESADYPPADLFLQYWVGRYGQMVLSRALKNESAGISSINRAMADSGFGEKFGDVFLNWVVADFVNDCLLGDGQKYCYFNSNLTNFKVQPTLTNVLPDQDNFTLSFSDKIKDWSGHWYKISGGGQNLNLDLKFSGDAAANFQVPVLVETSDNKRSLRFLKIDGKGQAEEFFSGFGSQIKDIVLMPFSQSKTAGFSADEPGRSFSYSASLTSSSVPAQPSAPVFAPPVSTPAPLTASNNSNLSYPDGSLIRAKNDFKVYVIGGKFKRWLQSSQVLAAYPHLLWQNIIDVDSTDLNLYRDAWLVRAAGDYRVFEINGDGTKHWLNMSADDFSKSGRDWGMIYEINKKELNWYKTGAEVLR